MRILSIPIAVLISVLLLESPASAQTPQGGDDSIQPEVAAQFGFLHFGEFVSSKVGFDVNFHTAQLTQPATPLGIRVGVAVDLALHHFSGGEDFFGTALGGYNFFTIAAGPHLTLDKVGSPKFQLFADVMLGIGHVSGDFPENDILLILMPGFDIPLEGQKFKIRVEVGPVWDFFDGGHDVGWRYMFGVAIPTK